ncbi:MAG: hypothetical protein AVDCRST_MAG41-4288 [uncultured Corynebacteriales bacterium]|uniref:Uncharacterized protein n=1 Tax=uncultured Mycobacteriales bacterium TaxID=581187 RepID=A0A6J4JWI0_9ACTN|nr:MAG: hypothetical protein AVDCRST_MAG41-4288 [uncultured Corynebacteriales bacterium]
MSRQARRVGPRHVRLLLQPAGLLRLAAGVRGRHRPADPDPHRPVLTAPADVLTAHADSSDRARRRGPDPERIRPSRVGRTGGTGQATGPRP